MARVSRFLAALLLILLAGCASAPRDAYTPSSWDQHRAQVAALNHWTASGKLALRTEQQAESVTMLWQQVGDYTHLRLSGPMGIQATTIESDGQTLRVRRGEEFENFDLDDPGAIRRDTGLDLPLEALPHWLRGIPAPAPAVQSMQLDADRDLLRQLHQGGWVIHFESYQLFDQLMLPTRLKLQRGGTSARVIVREWSHR